MDFEDFQHAINANEAPAELPPVLLALWWDCKGDWTKAHECAQQRETDDHAWVHAYLHRKEGDLENARYWYRRAGKPVFKGPLEDERTEIVKALLAR